MPYGIQQKQQMACGVQQVPIKYVAFVFITVL
jgi:hypothetical protein